MGQARVGACTLHRLLGTVLLGHLVACTSWRTQAVAPEALVRDRAPSAVRITRIDHSRVVVHRPVMEGDSIVGRPNEGDSTHGGEAPVTVPLNAIESVAIKRFDVLETVGVVLLVNLGWCVAARCLEAEGVP